MLFKTLAHAPMSFARLSHCQIDGLFGFLGPDCSQLRRACVLARERSNGVDLPFEILKWHCVNSTLRSLKLPVHILDDVGEFRFDVQSAMGGRRRGICSEWAIG